MNTPQLKGSLTDTKPLRQCGKCKRPAQEKGGCNLGARWVCAQCWRNRSNSIQSKERQLHR